MCGFAALFEPDRVFETQLLSAMDKDLFHRGPDAGGLHRETGMALVFRRLAILDPNPVSDQPMLDQDGRFCIVFNGEIYNFRRLRAELEQAGRRFRTEGDTEVLLEGFKHWGEGLLDRLEGMYAFVIWDSERQEAWAARDPFGIKPLYLARKGRLTAFASEMRPLRRLVGTEPDPVALAELLRYRFAAGRLSNLKHIELVPGGTLVMLRPRDGQYQERRFCDPLDFIGQDQPMTQAEALARVEETVIASVEDHLQSDVGYAVQLSGGVDSSLVTALALPRTAGRLRSYGIGLTGLSHDEAPYRKMIVERYPELDHREIPLTGKDMADHFPQAVKHMEGPVPHFGCVMLMILCKELRKHDKVVLTGEGADEFFGGYIRYYWAETQARQARWARRVPKRAWPLLSRWRSLERFSYVTPATAPSIPFDFPRLEKLFPDLSPAKGAWESPAEHFDTYLEQMMAVDQSAYLGSLLMRQDKLAMAESVEARVPFTHLPLARAINAIPMAMRLAERETKALLKKMAEQWLPSEILYRRKVGLTLPLDDWARDPEALGRYRPLLTAPDALLAAYGRPDAIPRLLTAFDRQEPWTRTILPHLINLELWLRSLREPLQG